LIRRVADWVDDRLGTTHFARSALNKVFPDHWSFLLGEIALYSFVVLVLTGTFLALFFEPSSRDVVYSGHYVPLQGIHMSAAYDSAVRLSFDVRAGLVIRQMHHWAALVFLAAIVCHVSRIFFTGAFRRPREINWLVGVTLLVLALFNGFSGYSMPDDLLSGTGLRIAYSIVLSVPVVGTWLAFLLFGGEFPGPATISRLFVVHIFVVPALIAALLSAHLAIVWRQKHTQFPGAGRTEQNVVGSRLWPTYAARSIGLFMLVVAVLAALAGLFQINPIWLYGPFQPAAVSTAAQPDWYLGWTEGALRLVPAFRLHVLGYRVPEVLVPGVILPMLTFTALYAWPFVERRITSDRAETHLLQRPRDHPVRTAIGTGALTFYVALTVGGAQDIIAQKLQVGIESVTDVLRLAVVVLPVLVATFTWKVCRDLAAGQPLDEWAKGGEPPIGPNDPEAAALAQATVSSPVS
jgi:ubiquinol-cytochrome c reductase cytochrome b subunit